MVVVRIGCLLGMLMLLFNFLPSIATAEDPAFASGWREPSLTGITWALRAKTDWCCDLDWKDPERQIVFCTRDIRKLESDPYGSEKYDLATRYYNRGNAYFDLKRYDKALSDYDKAIEVEIDPTMQFYNNRGLVYYMNGEYAAALADFDKAVKTKAFEYPYKALLNEGDALFKLGRFRDAIRSYSTALLKEPRTFLVQHTTSHPGYKQDPRKDEAACRTAAAGGYYKRGLAHQKRGEVDQAAADTEKSLQIIRSSSPVCAKKEEQEEP